MERATSGKVPHFAEPVLGLAEGETRGLNAGYEMVVTHIVSRTFPTCTPLSM